jgi:tRNA(fMet)-specific endonuclease VapC
MTAPSFVVDTSVVVDFLMGGGERLGRLVEQARPVSVPVVVLAELLAGARRSNRVAERVAQVENFVDRNTVLSCDPDTASYYADISNELRARGKPIPENDMWIASIALQHGLPLAARDKHFNHVDSLLRVPC